ncbi:MAG: hypothetical protein ACRD3D_08770 [Terriglobia bacterium]
MLERKIAGWIGIALAPAVAVAAIEDGAGQIASSSGAAVNGTAVPNQGTIMPGNALTTGLDGRAIVEFSGASQVNAFESTSVTFKREPGGIQAELSSGTVAARSLGSTTITVETPAYHIAPAEHGKSVYVVGILSDKTTVVSARVGKVEITQLASGKRYLLDEGHYAELAAPPTEVQPSANSPADAPEPAGSGPPGIGTAPASLFVLLVALGAGIGGGLLLDRALSGQSPASPSRP